LIEHLFDLFLFLFALEEVGGDV